MTRTLLGWAFDMWRNFWFAIDTVIDDALDVFGDDEADQW